MSGIYLLKPNQLEAHALTGMPDTIDDCFKAADCLKKRGIQQVIISLGANGYIISNAHFTKYYCIKENPVVVDSNGAGDAFFAGILFGLQHNKPIEEACELGATLAAKTIETYQSAITHGNHYENTI